MLITRTDVDWRLLVYGFLFMFWSSPEQTYLISLYSNETRAGALYSLATLFIAGVLVWSGLADRVDLIRLSLSLSLSLACFWL